MAAGPDPQAPPGPLRILAVASDPSATIARIRLAEPLAELSTQQGWALRLCSLHACSADDLAWADVLVLQRAVSRRAVRLMVQARSQGAWVVHEIDDLLTDPAPHLHGYPQALDNRVWVRQALALADVVSASTPRLAAALLPLSRRVELVPNCAWPGAAALPLAKPPLHGVLHLVLAASDAVQLDELLPALRERVAAAPGRVRLVAVGPPAAKLLEAGLPVQAEPLMPRDRFVAFVAALPGAVALIPLGSTPFDACKSAIKFFDYAACGVPVLAAAVPPYADVVEDGRTGRLVAPGSGPWCEALRELFDAPELAWQRAAAAREVVLARHGMEHSVQSWRTLLLSLGPRQRPAPTRPAWQRAGAALVQRLVQRLVQLNRDRLERRHRRRAGPGP